MAGLRKRRDQLSMKDEARAPRGGGEDVPVRRAVPQQHGEDRGSQKSGTSPTPANTT